LKWVKDLAERGGYHIACFLAQQVGEKALKAFLYAQDQEIVLGYSIARLCEEAGQTNSFFKEAANRWTILDGYFIPTRYPNGLPDSIPAKVYTHQAAKEAAALAEEIVSEVRKLLFPIMNTSQ